MVMQEEKHDPYLFQVSLKIILKNKKGEILVLAMPKNSSMAGFYDVPGGRINSDELKMSYEKIFKREVAEEVGKSVKYRLIKRPVSISRHPYFSAKFQKEMYIIFIFFEATYLSGKIKTSSEHIGYQWLKLDKKNVSKYFARGLYEGFKNYFEWTA
jgi:ADP-ribose pyrophosphatase YjhB (NUDIX family)